jgi:hypothetical protein
LLHMTLLEKICENTEKATVQNKLTMLEKMITDGEKSIILVSGRGRPSNLPDHCYYLHYSILQNYLLFNRSKFLLARVLYSIRKT